MQAFNGQVNVGDAGKDVAKPVTVVADSVDASAKEAHDPKTAMPQAETNVEKPPAYTPGHRSRTSISHLRSISEIDRAFTDVLIQEH